jgi:UDP-glucose 4-epimerase
VFEAARKTPDRADFNPGMEPRRAGDTATRIADGRKAKEVPAWASRHGVESMIGSAAAWHGSQTYTEAVIGKANASSG